MRANEGGDPVAKAAFLRRQGVHIFVVAIGNFSKVYPLFGEGEWK